MQYTSIDAVTLLQAELQVQVVHAMAVEAETNVTLRAGCRLRPFDHITYANIF